MDQSHQDPQTPSAPHKSSPETADLSRAAVGWGLALLAGVSLATWSAGVDRRDRAALEHAAEATAVGDQRLYPLDSSHPPPIQLGGSPLVLSSKTPEQMIEAKMRLNAYTDDASFRLYVPVERENGDTEVGGPSWYVKAGSGLFLRFTR